MSGESEKKDMVILPTSSEEAAIKKDFVVSKGLTSAEAAQLLQKWGRNELEDKQKPKVKYICCFDSLLNILLLLVACVH